MKLLSGLMVTLIALAAMQASAQSRYQEPGREKLFPKNFGYKDDNPPLFPKNYGYRYEKPAPAEPWRNPYAGGDGRESRGSHGLRSSGGSDITGFKREPLGGGSWMDRVR